MEPILHNLPLILLILASLSLITYQIVLILRQKSNNRIATDKNKKLEALCKGLYSEYSKVKGPEWATNTLNSIISDVVKKDVVKQTC